MSLDEWITGNYGEDQFRDQDRYVCPECHEWETLNFGAGMKVSCDCGWEGYDSDLIDRDAEAKDMWESVREDERMECRNGDR